METSWQPRPRVHCASYFLPHFLLSFRGNGVMKINRHKINRPDKLMVELASLSGFENWFIGICNNKNHGTHRTRCDEGTKSLWDITHDPRTACVGNREGQPLPDPSRPLVFRTLRAMVWEVASVPARVCPDGRFRGRVPLLLEGISPAIPR